MSVPLSPETKAWRLIAFIAIGLLVLVLLFESVKTLTSTDQKSESEPAKDSPAVAFEIVSFAELPGWTQDRHGDALAPFLRSCEKILLRAPDQGMNSHEALGLEGNITLAGAVADWKTPCQVAAQIALGGPKTTGARKFFETYFVPVKLVQPTTDEEWSGLTDTGMFTGYFEPTYKASRMKTEEHSVPVLSRPEDLVMVDLGAFREDLAGKRIAGRVNNGQLIPYASHEDIVTDGIDADLLAWMNPNDLLFLQIQGSGKLLVDGDELRVGYAAQNGHAYTAIGGPLIRSGAIAREDMSMQAIYAWLDAAEPDEAAALRYVNDSYVFFRPLNNLPNPKLGPLGAGGVQLTKGRSLAIDRRYHAMGAPIWIDVDGLEPGTQDQRLVIAQDTGGAIKGPVRGDLFVGSGKAAGDIAGRMRQAGRLYVLLPISIAERLEAHHEQAPTQ